MPLALFTNATPLTPIRNLFNTIINYVNSHVAENVADLTALDALAATNEGQRMHVDEMNCDFQAMDGVWKQVGISRFATEGARTTAYNKVSGAYRVSGAQSRVDALSRIDVWLTTSADAVNVSGWFPLAGQLPQFRIRQNTAAQTVNATNTPLQLAAASITRNIGGFTFTDANDTVAVPVPGVYRIHAKMYMGAGTSGNRGMYLSRNSTATSIAETADLTVTAGAVKLEFSADVTITDITDVFRLIVLTSGGAAIAMGLGGSTGYETLWEFDYLQAA